MRLVPVLYVVTNERLVQTPKGDLVWQPQVRFASTWRWLARVMAWWHYGQVNPNYGALKIHNLHYDQDL